VTRIIAGAARGRRLAVPPVGTRPTSDRVREAVFSAVESTLGPLGGARVLDLYAGSGAIGLEALSRGAAEVLLVERDRAALAVLRRNVDTVGLPGARVLADDATRAVARPPSVGGGGPLDLVYVDPPYDLPAAEVESVLAGLATGWLAEGALVLVERSRRDADLAWPPGYEPERTRTYGETVVLGALWYGRDEVPAATGAAPA
jgi:16S rRNA (guanine966-N2)-methyltransferase